MGILSALFNSMKSTHDFHIYIPKQPVDLWAKLRGLAKQQRRTATEEILIAIEKHLQSNNQLTDREIKKMRE